MKFSLMLSLLVFSAAALASPGRPRTIVCTSDAVSNAARSFTIDNLNSEEPTSTIPNTSTLEANSTRTITQLFFSNECDNMYEITLSYTELEQLKMRKIQEVRGLMYYYDSELREARGEDDVEGETLSITCKLP